MTTSPAFGVVGAATYDTATDTLTRHALAGWYVEIVRYNEDPDGEQFENVLIGPFDNEGDAEEHCDSADVEDWCYGEAKQKGYTVDDVKIVHNPTLIPSYGVNTPVYPVYAEGACLGILPGTEH